MICPYCGKPAVYVDSSEIYDGKSYGMIYLCRPCNAYVGVHKGTDRPLGRMADAELRKWKKNVHAMFDPIWKNGEMSRREAYRWLAGSMDLETDETHIGMFNVEQCKMVCSLVRLRMKGEIINVQSR